jgi:hypothetical protein
MSMDIHRDKHVAFILGRAFQTSKGLDVGLPAFDAKKELVGYSTCPTLKTEFCYRIQIGFYKSAEGFDNVSYAAFTHIGSLVTSRQVADADIHLCGRMFSDALAAPTSGCVFSLQTSAESATNLQADVSVSKRNRYDILNFEKMKEDALIHSMMSSLTETRDTAQDFGTESINVESDLTDTAAFSKYEQPSPRFAVKDSISSLVDEA